MSYLSDNIRLKFTLSVKYIDAKAMGRLTIVNINPTKSMLVLYRHPEQEEVCTTLALIFELTDGGRGALDRLPRPVRSIRRIIYGHMPPGFIPPGVSWPKTGRASSSKALFPIAQNENVVFWRLGKEAKNPKEHSALRVSRTPA